MTYRINSEVPIYFSFCIYGTKSIYYEGLIKNLDTIANIEPQPTVLIGYSDDILEEYKTKYEAYAFVKMLKIDKEFGESIMCSRLLQLDTIQTEHNKAYVFCRDADSRVSKRDIWCMQSFIDSGRKLHIIRDHYYHKQKIMGGTCGFYLESQTRFTEMFRASQNEFVNMNKSYGLDEYFLSNKIYGLFNKEDIFIHSNCVGLLNETINTINIEHDDDSDFIGNVYEEDNRAHFTYSNYINYQHLEWLATQKQWNLIIQNRERADFENKWNKINFLLDAAIKAKNLNVCLELCSNFEYITIDELIMSNSDRVIELAKELSYEIVATSDIERKPQENEFVICYGQYPHSIECLPTKSRILYRHPIYFSNVTHTHIEYNKCWEPVSTIYILNLEERRDRYFNILVELCRVQAPLNRIHHYKAQKTSYTGNRTQDAYIGATNNHLEVVQHFIKSGNIHSLILEDDITFISDTNQIYKSIANFFSNPVEYDITFLAYSKYGPFKKHNDLLTLSYQPCTTSSAYLINKETANLIENCLQIGVEQMKAGQPSHIYCCDRFWACLQNRNKMFLFRRKLAFQTITHSDITSNINYAFD
jgi:GR25 family glycosyltransferase involved in LPS biosynthesis